MSLRTLPPEARIIAAILALSFVIAVVAAWGVS